MDNRNRNRLGADERCVCQCGRPIPAKKIVLAYITGSLLQCSYCRVMTTAISPSSVAGNLCEWGEQGFRSLKDISCQN